MSVRENNQSLIIIDALNGQVITTIDLSLYQKDTMNIMIKDLLKDYVFDNERGLIIKIGYKN